MTHEEIHNIWLHMSGKAEGLLEAGGTADLPVMFANAILGYNKREWQGLTDEEMHECWDSPLTPLGMKHARMIEAKLKEKNGAQA